MPRRATSSAAKAERRSQILAAAIAAFDRFGYDAMSMEWLAESAGVAKGTLYLYFPTKESVFLAVYLDELAGWFEAVNMDLDTLPANDLLRAAGLLVDTLDRFPRLPALSSILHTVLERNIKEADALAFRQTLLQHVATTGERLEGRLDFLAPGDGARLLLRLHALIIGCWHAATPGPVVRKVLARPELSAFRINFSEELENTLVLLLEGWRRAGGGF